MDSQKTLHCPHYQIYSEPLEMEGPTSYLAVRRCLLTERLVKHLAAAPEGESLAQKLVVQTSGGRTFGVVGPDLDAVTQKACARSRCEDRCTPAYRQHLGMFGITDAEEDTVTCQDVEPQPPSVTV